MRHVERRDFLACVRRPELTNCGERQAAFEVPADIEPIDRFAFMGSQQRRFQSGTALFDVGTQFDDELCRKSHHAVALFAVADWQSHAALSQITHRHREHHARPITPASFRSARAPSPSCGHLGPIITPWSTIFGWALIGLKASSEYLCTRYFPQMIPTLDHSWGVGMA